MVSKTRNQLTKNVAGIIGLTAITLELLFDKRLGVTVRSMFFWRGGLLALAIIAPWHIIMYIQHKSEFLNQYIWYAGSSDT